MNTDHNSALNPVVLVVCDGLGYTNSPVGNAVQQATMTFFDNLARQYPSAYLAAAGEAVGLLPEFAGNSQVGHITLGAGRVIKSSILRFEELIESGNLMHHKAALLLRDFAQTGKKLHLLGLLSDGGVHAHQRHLYAMLDLAVQCDVIDIVVHPILDGRDVAPTSARLYLEQLEQKLQQLGHGVIGSLQGRFYAMDRDKNDDRTDASYKMMCGLGDVGCADWHAALTGSYAAGQTDEFVPPILFAHEYALNDGDAVIFINVRPDRAIQITERLVGCYPTPIRRDFAFVITGYRYSQHFHNPVILEPELVYHTVLDEVSTQQPGRPIFLLAETEKYAHVTYFFKGMRDDQLPQETRIMIPSLKMNDYITHPEMAACSITEHLEEVLAQKPNAFCVVNYANADMVGHSGNLAATIKACQVLDEHLAVVFDLVVNKMGGLLVVTADHGNAESMLDDSGNPKTAHTKNPVLLIIAAPGLKHSHAQPLDLSLTHGIAHVAPTLLNLMGITPPSVMVEPLVL